MNRPPFFQKIICHRETKDDSSACFDIYRDRLETWNLDLAKAPGFDDRDITLDNNPDLESEQAQMESPPEEQESIETLPAEQNLVQIPFASQNEHSPPDPTTPNQESSSPYPWPKRITTSHVIGHQDEKCVPFATNYTSLEILLAPNYSVGHIMPMVNLRGHRFDNTTYSANVGVGGRYIPNHNSRFCQLLGFNAFYDYRQGCFGYYQQLGAGVEILGKRWDIRGNIYVPFGEKLHGRTCFFNQYTNGYFIIRRDLESVSYSFNAEVGYAAIQGKNFLLYIATGPYFIAGRGCASNTPGIEIRLCPQYKDYLSLDLSYRYDELFRSIWQAAISVTLPLYQISEQNRHPCGLSDRHIYQSIRRFEVLPLDNQTHWQTNY